jgi:hypothetical protein
LYEFSVVVVSEVVFDGEVANVVFVSVDNVVVCLPVWSVESVYGEVTALVVVVIVVIVVIAVIAVVAEVGKDETVRSDAASAFADLVCVEVCSVRVVSLETAADPVDPCGCDTIEVVAVSVVKIDGGPVLTPPEGF